MKPIHVHLAPSKWALAINILVHFALVALIWLYFEQPWLWSALALASVVHTHYRMTRASGRLTELNINPQGLLSVAKASDKALSPATLLDGSVFARWVMVLYIQNQGKKQVLWLLPDSIEADAYQQLLVWGRWHSMNEEA
ncbi:protein YgfX [Neisseriaceae bacterium CLB008]